MLKKWKQKRLSAILQAHEDYITGPSDLLADKPPSIFFYLLGGWYGKMMCRTPEDSALKRSIRWRRAINPVLKRLVPLFMKVEQVTEDRNVLLGIPGKDEGIKLPLEPVIWAANHGFLDDVAATVATAARHAVIVFGSLPMFYNTFDGVSAALNGVVLTNRKSKKSSATAVEKAVRVMANRADTLIFPEGIWNKTPNRLMLELWPGIYRIARESGAKIVPVVHYIEDAAYKKKQNKIHTVIDEPLSVEGMTEEEALRKLRDILAGWYYLMMERYGRSTREAELSEYGNVQDAWKEHLRRRVGVVARYDREIELHGDYRPKRITEPDAVWEKVAQIEKVNRDNAVHIAYASKVVQERREQDFQRRF